MKKGILISPVEKASTSFAGSNTSPAWSPDGKYLAYVSKRQRGPARVGSQVLCIKNLTSEKVKVFTPELRIFGRIMYWAPDGRSVIVTGNDKEGQPGLFTINTTTGETITLFKKENGKPVPGFVLAPDGKTIYHRKNVSQKNINQIFEYNLSTKQQKEIHSDSSIYNLIISPDGKSLAYCSNDKVSKEIVMKFFPIKGGEPREIMRIKEPEKVYSLSPAWSSDGLYIIFGKGLSSMQDQKIDLCRVSVDGGTPQKLGISMDRISHVRIHPDGKQIAFFAGQIKAEIWVMENFLPKKK
jgi:Tol biopolymer transport system component